MDPPIWYMPQEKFGEMAVGDAYGQEKGITDLILKMYGVDFLPGAAAVGSQANGWLPEKE